jgi:IS6 family transposase
MSKQRRAARVRQDQVSKGRQFTAEVILWAVRWYLMFPISYRDLELMLLDRGIEVDYTTIFHWSKRMQPNWRRGSGRTGA